LRGVDVFQNRIFLIDMLLPLATVTVTRMDAALNCVQASQTAALEAVDALLAGTKMEGLREGQQQRIPLSLSSPLISPPLPSSFIVTTELAAADEAAASTASTLPTLTGAASDLRKRLAKAGATLEKVEARVRRVAAAAPQPEERAAG
jgi:hypothetical protein